MLHLIDYLKDTALEEESLPELPRAVAEKGIPPASPSISGTQDVLQSYLGLISLSAHHTWYWLQKGKNSKTMGIFGTDHGAASVKIHLSALRISTTPFSWELCG